MGGGDPGGFGAGGGSGAPGPAPAPPGAPVSGSSSSSSSGLVGAIGSPGDRIQLAPLRASHGHGGSGNVVTSPHMSSSSHTTLSGPGSSAGYPGPVMHSRSGNGSGNGYGNPRDVPMERDRERGRRDGDRGVKKNPLSIGSIISDETG